MPAFRSVAFGDLDGHLWGAAIDGHLRLLALGTSSGLQHRLGRGAIQWTTSGRRWTLTTDGLQLTIDPCNPPAQLDAGTGDPAGVGTEAAAGAATETGDGLDQLCHVAGWITVDGAEREIDCQGTRTTRDHGVDLHAIDSLRGFCAWFGAGEGLIVLSLRPRGATDHSRDLATASIFAPKAWQAAAETRLSTTYTADGYPARVGLELWLANGDEHYPRRAAGEVAGPAVDLRAEGLEVRVAPLRCHSRGLDGAGVYVLARRG